MVGATELVMSPKTCRRVTKSPPRTRKKGSGSTAHQHQHTGLLAGLREEIDYRTRSCAIDGLRDFVRRLTDETGSPLAIRAFRMKSLGNYAINSSAAKLKPQGIFDVSLLPIVREPNLKFNLGLLTHRSRTLMGTQASARNLAPPSRCSTQCSPKTSGRLKQILASVARDACLSNPSQISPGK